MLVTVEHHHRNFLPPSVAKLGNPQTDIPRIAKDKKHVAEIEAAVHQIRLISLLSG